MKIKVLSVLVLVSIISGCAMQPQSLGYGIIQNSVDPITATSETSPKVGKACGYNIFGIYAGGDMSIELAKYNGGITKVSSVNSSVFSIFGLIAKRCTIVSGS
jgi:hypothetical protein